MKKTTKIICCWLVTLFSLQTTQCQILDSLALNKEPVYYSFEQTDTIAKTTVYRLHFKHKLPENFNTKITGYPHLQELTLTGMRLKEIPPIVYSLSSLTRLNVSNNKIEEISSDIAQLTHLEELIINRNYLYQLPKEVATLKDLRYIDMWSTNVIELPEEIANLENSIKIIDLRAVRMSEVRQNTMQNLLPKTKFYFSPYCNCKL